MILDFFSDENIENRTPSFLTLDGILLSDIIPGYVQPPGNSESHQKTRRRVAAAGMEGTRVLMTPPGPKLTSPDTSLPLMI